jgi:pimeloyl-ACP methyl ester carboxylesterase
VKAPVLLIIGGRDTDVIRLNEVAFAQLDSNKAIEIVPGASHLFEEPGTLAEAARLSAEWFTRHLAGKESAQKERLYVGQI